jgi:hypothetical protein
MALWLAADDSRMCTAQTWVVDGGWIRPGGRWTGSMARSLILSGGGEYRDPWHPFAATSERLAGLLAALGHAVEVSEPSPTRSAICAAGTWWW